jgi:RNA polymerase sigma factor (sigma-70 family)
MGSEPADVMPRTDESERAEMIRSAVVSEFVPISRAVGAMVRSVERGRDREWVRQRTEEVLAITLLRALEHPGSFDPTRQALGWIVGIARNVMKGEARLAHGRPRQADIDEVALESALGAIDPTRNGSADRLDIERMLTRLSPGQRRAIDLRYFQGKSDLELVQELGVTTAEAARARVFRAVQALRDLYAQDRSEVDR